MVGLIMLDDSASSGEVVKAVYCRAELCIKSPRVVSQRPASNGVIHMQLQNDQSGDTEEVLLRRRNMGRSMKIYID